MLILLMLEVDIETDFIYDFGCINFYVFRNWKNKGIAKPVK